MLPTEPFKRIFPGITPLTVFLLVTVGLAGWLGFQAVDAAVSQRRTAEAVLRDYASISATELARYSRANLLDVLDDAFDDVDGFRRGIPSASEVRGEMGNAARGQGCSCPAFRNPLAVFRLTTSDGLLEVLPDTVRPAVRDRLAAYARARAAAVDRAPDGLTTFAPGGLIDRPAVVGYHISEDNGVVEAVFGFVVDAAGIGEFFGEWYEERRLLPAPIAGDQPNDSVLYVTVTGAGGTTLFASPVPYPMTFTAAAPIGERFDEIVVNAAVRPDAAGQLIIGGLPNSRLPLLAALLLVTLGVGAAAVLQLRKEQEFQRLRDDFVSGVSHELRTPLAQIRMFAELQESGKLGSEEDRTRAVRVVHREAKRLSHLVDNILQFSRLRRSPGQGMPMEPLDFAEALAEGVDAVAPLLQDRGVRLVVEAEKDVPILANRDALTRIVVNLLDNAAKYGPAGQTVRVEAARRNGAVQLAVSDQGPGVPPADRERVWKPYRRLERDVKARITGSGIGLAVVAQLAEFHRGRSWVEEAPGGGARFVVELPLAEDDFEEEARVGAGASGAVPS